MSRKPHSIAGSFLTLIFWIALTVGVLLIVFRILVSMGMKPPVRSYVVQSGSMEPSIMTGDVILIRDQPSYDISDVVTFHDEKKRVVTHRIVEKSGDGAQTAFLTKGDANRSIDIEQIPATAIMGKVTMSIPKLGFAVNFAKSTLGIILLVIVPATIIIYDELSIIASSYKRR